MKTILHLISEFVSLNEAKIRKGGKLSRKSEARWSELKDFYDLLMDYNGVCRDNLGRRFTSGEIRDAVPRRKHLRVPVTMDVIFEHQGQFHSGRVANLGVGGVFLSSDTLLDLDSRLTLYLVNVGRGSDAVMPIEGEVAWKRDSVESNRPRGMGIRFANVPEPVHKVLDSFVLETLERHLRGLSPSLLSPDFLDREKIKL